MSGGARMARAVALALALVASLASARAVATSSSVASTVRAPDPRSPDCRGRSTPSIDALQLLELQISYTTLLARYYVPVDPRAIVRGAHAGVESLLRRCGVVDRRTVRATSHQDGSERIDTDFLTALTSYGSRVSASALVSEIIAGELAELHDPYTVLFRPVAFRAFNTFLQGESFGGVGIVLDASQSRPRVASVISGGPAERVGIRGADTIAAIDGIETTGLSTNRLRELLRGEPGTVVRVAIVRAAAISAALPEPPAQSLTFAIAREIVRDPQTISRLIDPNVGYVRLARFGDGAAGEVATAIAALASRGAASFVLDLRGNGGGYGDAATGVASIFIASGTIYTTRERTGPPVEERAKPGTVVRAPLAVLVDHDTASASEIVAGALQDDRRATIVGVQTFGKGVVQSVFPLPDGAAIKMTTARYYTPSGRSIEHLGITPDVVVTEPPDASTGDPARDAQLARALAVLAAAPPARTASPPSP